MKKLLTLLLLSFATICFAKVGDSHKGIWPVTDKAQIKSLNGTWMLKVKKGVDDTEKSKGIPTPDASWKEIPVPGNWERYGFSESVYSFPDSLTGYYRIEFSVPAEWKGEQVCLRLDGVLRGYDLWINDKKAGEWELPYNTCLFDITPFLTKGAFKGEPQQLAMRVYSHYKGYEFDCFDDWAPMGIFRDVTLFAVPKTHLSDLTVSTDTDGTINVRTEISNKTKNTTVDYEVLDANGRVVSRGEKIRNPHLWTPETPYLYTLSLNVKDKGKTLQTFEQKIGLRKIEIKDGNVMTVNGQTVKFRGVDAHATDPYRIKVISDSLTLRDLRMMKEAGINFIRMSHYPREPRFFEMCDSMGFYVMCEVPFGSRGERHLNDSTYIDNLRTRASATITRHKNYPSVAFWSLGNENPFTKICQDLGYYVKGIDDGHLICYPQKGGFNNVNYEKFPKVADFYAPHYPNVSVIEKRFTAADRPVILTEYNHTLGTAFEDHDKLWEKIEAMPNMAGGAVWEWADQGVPFSESRADRYGYEEKVYTSQEGGFQMFGNKGTDGLVYADRVPLPNYYELKRNYAQAFVKDESVRLNPSDNTVSFVIKNRHDFRNLKDNVTFYWTLTADRDTLASGAFSPDCAPHGETFCTITAQELPEGSLGVLGVEIRDNKGYHLLDQAFLLQGDAAAKVASIAGEHNKLPQPMMRVGRKPTLAEKQVIKDKRVKKYLQPMDNPYVKGEVVTDGDIVGYTLTPVDTTNRMLSEVGVAYLLDKDIDRVQWIGQGPFPTYPGRRRANRYGYWEKHMDDVYFEGNHMGIDVCWLSDKDGNGVLISGKDLNINFEQTDNGIVVTVNDLVSGQSPKFNVTPYYVSGKTMEPLSGEFRMQSTKSGYIPALMKDPSEVAAPFKPYYTQYDTYLMRLEDIWECGGKAFSCDDQKTPVYIVAGQSNTDGRAEMEEMQEEILKYVKDGGASDILMSYCNGMTRMELGKFEPYVPMYEGNTSARCGFDAILYNRLAARSEKPIYVIKESKGGTAIDTLCKSSGNLYWCADEDWMTKAGMAKYDRDTKETSGQSLLLQLEANIDSCINSTLSKLPGGYEMKCIIWHQGESDRAQGDRYYENLKKLIDHLRNHIAEATGDSTYLTLPFIAGGVSTRSRQYSDAVENAKRRLAEEDPTIHYVDLEGCELRSDDRLHFNGKGCQEAAGRIMGKLEEIW